MPHFIKENLTKFLTTYKTAIADAKEDTDKKIVAILKLLQNAEHMHVFYDGNARIFYMVLLYYLFIKNGMKVPMMDNINKIAGYAMDELILEVGEGWKNQDTLSRDDSLFGVSTLDILSYCNPEELEYFIASLKPLVPYFKPSKTFDLIDALVSKDAPKVDRLIADDSRLLKIAYKLFKIYYKTNNPSDLELKGFYETYLKSPEPSKKRKEHPDETHLLSEKSIFAQNKMPENILDTKNFLKCTGL